jgi:2,3-bisphosphoglycerate-dependent phosphoglycerate mutase
MGISVWRVSLLLLVVVAWEVSSLVAPKITDSRLKKIRHTFHLSSSPSDFDEDSEDSDADNNNSYFSVNGEPRQTVRVNGYTMAAGNSRYSAMLEDRGVPLQRLLQQRRRQPVKVDEEDEDGWGKMRKRKRVWWKNVIRAPLKVAKRILEPAATEPGTLILVRHGESVWNANKTFTGWADPDLSERGEREVEHAARLLLEGGYEIDVCFTSRLKRAIRSTWMILDEMNEVYLPVFKSWRLNERSYGKLQGLSKTDTAEQLGTELVQEWRGSLRSRPPAMSRLDEYWPGKDRKYADLSLEQLPLSESLMDCMERTAPVWEQKIVYELRKGRNVMVVAHANTLRGLVKTIDNIGDDEISEVAIPTGIPIIYKFDKDMKPIPPSGEAQTASQVHMKGLFLEKPGLLKEALKREDEWSMQVPGYNPTMARNRKAITSLERSLFKLQAERELGAWAGQFVDPNAPETDDGNDGNSGKPMQMVEDEVWAKGLQELEEGGQFDPDAPVFHDAGGKLNVVEEKAEVKPVLKATLISNQPCVTNFPSESIIPGMGNVPIRRESVIVIIRHGKTEHNKLGLFTGWEDAPLATDGVAEAKEAGRLLKAHGFEFDVVYTSWLSRAIETSLHVMDELDSLWLPIVKTWRLNER